MVRRRRTPLPFRAILSLVVLFLCAVPARGQVPPAACENWVARLVSFQGAITYRRAAARVQPVTSVALNETFCVGDVLELGAFSRAALQLPDQTVVRLDQGTVVTFAAPQDDKRTWLDILKGALHIISRDPRALRVVTPFANAGIEGTEFLVQVGADAATVLVFEGRVKVANASGDATAGSGESVLARAGTAPVLQQVVRPRDQVVWTLYYPPTGRGADPQVARVDELLAVGRVTEAEADLAAVLARSPGNSEALARQSVIALIRNDPATAGALADQAVAADPASSSARLAQSYVRQSAGDLAGAIATLEAAAQSHPGDALVLARLAELHLAMDDVRRSEASANAAVAADPGLALAHTILGFAKLARADRPQASAAFEEAVRLDPAAPLPRLGLGLVKIRGGDLVAGREEIETAVILDPNNSLVRSYMGKAYYEEKRDSLAASQLAIAKELDPNDPTPWFYDAIRLQKVNDPARALKDLQGSIARNDRRVVFRSRLKLDEDLAARSSALGRIFNDLGFDELGLREGWTSVAAEPAEHSGHRLLADSYVSLPRHEIARVSELQKSQLLQPLNMTPVQPQLGDANLFVLDTAGPARIGFNEFNPLFSANGLGAQTSLVVGGNDTMGADAVLAGIHDNWSFSLGGFHFETDGYRENNDLDQDLASALVQYRASEETSWLLEARLSRREQGDLALYFDPTNYISDLRQSEDTESIRVGVRHAVGRRSLILGQVSYQWADLDTVAGSFFSVVSDADGLSAELQFLHQGERWHLTTGVRYRDRETDATTATNIPIDDPPFAISLTETTRAESDLLSAYAYVDYDVTDRLQLTVGAAGEELEGGLEDSRRVHPKIGVRWEASDSTVVRAGAFRALREFAFSRQDIALTLEPTQVAGFNQFFADSEGTEAWRYGVAVDQRVGDQLYVGAELSKRDRDVPFLQAGGPPDFGFTVVTNSAEDTNGRTYLYWLPTDYAATSISYQFDRQTRDPIPLPDNLLSVNTHRIPLEARFFSPGGFGARLAVTWIDQSGRFLDAFFSEIDADESFWVWDLGLSYRLPGRRGLIGLDVRNLFDEDNRFQDLDPQNPRISPERLALLRATLAF